ncbi:hypothetical protein [Caenimonas koreensis]|uniref:Uncharacterized protein n=1 Tax=Caenimonas koreensis DSM 17982 TaxID=1121255 RepID=A0A844AVI6_9BURK|nr:hypothetical protein [Caenimonas koreensis]MRD48415.1 hypothetical protein [Caenimonas koreensis DSM 17982]
MAIDPANTPRGPESDFTILHLPGSVRRSAAATHQNFYATGTLQGASEATPEAPRADCNRQLPPSEVKRDPYHAAVSPADGTDQGARAATQPPSDSKALTQTDAEKLGERIRDYRLSLSPTKSNLDEKTGLRRLNLEELRNFWKDLKAFHHTIQLSAIFAEDPVSGKSICRQTPIQTDLSYHMDLEAWLGYNIDKHAKGKSCYEDYLERYSTCMLIGGQEFSVRMTGESSRIKSELDDFREQERAARKASAPWFAPSQDEYDTDID